MFESLKNAEPGEIIQLSNGTGKILFSREQIRERIRELGKELSATYAENPPILVAVLRGGFIFQCDLARASEIPLEVDFISVSRYNPEEKGATSVKVLHDLRSDVHNRNVVVIEGIRTGSSKIEYIDSFLKVHNPASVEYAALVCQEGGRNKNRPLQYKGFDINDEFVIGFGLDYKECYRNLPIIAEFTPST